MNEPQHADRDHIVTRGQLIERARAMLPALRERSAQTESLRRIAPETVADFLAAGFLRIAQPARFGGMGHDLSLVAEIAMELGRSCASSAWMAAQWPSHNFMVGYFPLQAQLEYWKDGDDVFSSTASAVVRSEVEPAKDGWTINGHWRFSSGVDEARWVLLASQQGLCLIPRSDFQIVDDWHVSGLSGSGSKSVVVDRGFVPMHRFVSADIIKSGRTYGFANYESAFYKVPHAVWAPAMLAAAVIGMAQGVIDRFDERITARKDGNTGLAAHERPGAQLRFAEASADVDSARLLLQELFSGSAATARRGEEMNLLDRARYRRDTAYVVKRSVGAVSLLMESGDASAIYATNPVQRLARDIRAAALHVSLTWDEPAIQYSRVRWDLTPQTRLI